MSIGKIKIKIITLLFELVPGTINNKHRFFVQPLLLFLCSLLFLFYFILFFVKHITRREPLKNICSTAPPFFPSRLQNHTTLYIFTIHITSITHHTHTHIITTTSFRKHYTRLIESNNFVVHSSSKIFYTRFTNW